MVAHTVYTPTTMCDLSASHKLTAHEVLSVVWRLFEAL